MDTIISFIVSVIYLLPAEVSGVLSGLPIPAIETATPVFHASACTIPGGGYSTCSPGYSMDCSRDLRVSSEPCCICPEGTFIAGDNNCTRCTAYTDCTGREGDITTDRRCGDRKVTTVSGVLGKTTLTPPNATSMPPATQFSTGSPVLPADGTTGRGVPPGEASTIFGSETWNVILSIVIVLLLLYIFRKRIRYLIRRCRGRREEKMSPLPSVDPEAPTPMVGVAAAEANDDVVQTGQLADAGANT